MKFESRSADAFRRVDIVVNNAGIRNLAPLTAWQKDRSTAGRAVAMLAFAAGLLVAALGARAADEPARPPVDRRASRHGQRPRAADREVVRAAQSARRQRPRREVRRRALPPADRSAAGDLTGFPLEYPPSGSARR
jgi:hypothetical protein